MAAVVRCPNHQDGGT